MAKKNVSFGRFKRLLKRKAAKNGVTIKFVPPETCWSCGMKLGGDLKAAKKIAREERTANGMPLPAFVVGDKVRVVAGCERGYGVRGKVFTVEGAYPASFYANGGILYTLEGVGEMWPPDALKPVKRIAKKERKANG